MVVQLRLCVLLLNEAWRAYGDREFKSWIAVLEPVSRDQIHRREQGHRGMFIFPVPTSGIGHLVQPYSAEAFGSVTRWYCRAACATSGIGHLVQPYSAEAFGSVTRWYCRAACATSGIVQPYSAESFGRVTQWYCRAACALSFTRLIGVQGSCRPDTPMTSCSPGFSFEALSPFSTIHF